METDIEIARAANMLPIREIASGLGIAADSLQNCDCID
jgi:formyltetrahydrofolate synthetase